MSKSIQFENLVPETYVNQSRDFQMMCAVLDIAFNACKADAEDILYFSVAGVGFFLVAYRMNDGILRWYAFAGCALGAYVYYRTLARPLERVRKWLLQRLGKRFKIRKKRKRKNGADENEGNACEPQPNKENTQERA